MNAAPGGYLERYDAAPDADKFPLVRGWIDNEPLPFFKELRERRPILVTPECTLVALYDEVTEVLAMPRVFTVRLYLPKMSNGIYLMAHDDDALHTREKSLMQAMLNRDDLPKVRAMVARIAGELLDEAAGRMDAVARIMEKNAACAATTDAIVDALVDSVNACAMLVRDQATVLSKA